MKTIQTTIQVTEERTATLHLPPDIEPGEHQVVLVIEGKRNVEIRPSLDFPVDHYGSWPDDLSLRREDLYGDHGR